MSRGVIQVVIGCELVDFGEIINTDHRGFLVDIDLKAYFETEIEEI